MYGRLTLPSREALPYGGDPLRFAQHVIPIELRCSCAGVVRQNTYERPHREIREPSAGTLAKRHGTVFLIDTGDDQIVIRSARHITDHSIALVEPALKRRWALEPGDHGRAWTVLEVTENLPTEIRRRSRFL